MPLFKSNKQVQAVQWNKHGDHPYVVRIPPGVASHHVPDGVAADQMGYFNQNDQNKVVAPGSWILGPDASGNYSVVTNEQFSSEYQEVVEDEAGNKTTVKHRSDDDDDNVTTKKQSSIPSEQREAKQQETHSLSGGGARQGVMTSKNK